MIFIQRPGLTVNPPEAKRFLNGIVIGDAFFSGSDRWKHKPDFRFGFEMVRQPVPPLAAVRKEHGFLIRAVQKGHLCPLEQVFLLFEKRGFQLPVFIRGTYPLADRFK